MELSEALPVHKYHNNLSLPDPHGEAGENVPRATEGSGHHYLGKKDKPPSDVEHINKKEWDDMGSDFSALKKYLPKPHPDLDKDYTGKAFGIMPYLLCESEIITKLNAICNSCGDNAFFTKRISNDKKQILLGELDKYEANCRYCFYKYLQTYISNGSFWWNKR